VEIVENPLPVLSLSMFAAPARPLQCQIDDEIQYATSDGSAKGDNLGRSVRVEATLLSTNGALRCERDEAECGLSGSPPGEVGAKHYLPAKESKSLTARIRH
jgi:hypothetical protein